MAPTVLYTSCVLGAIGLYLLLRPGRRMLHGIGALLGLGALAWVIRSAAVALGTPGEGVAEPFYAIFSLIAVAAAVRMITHHKPVYAALYFVLVVLASAGLFLLLQAEFMAFALVIVYAGAILVTYLFVLMLAQQAPEGDEERFEAEYDLSPREPGAAVAVGFILLALLGDTIFSGVPELTPLPGGGAERFENIRLVGFALIARFPVSLELAGVILLLAMYGAVVLARRQFEISESEKRRHVQGGAP